MPMQLHRIEAVKNGKIQSNNFYFLKKFLAQNIHCGYTLELEPPCRGGTNEYPQCMFGIKIKNIRYNHKTVLKKKSGL